MICQEIRTHTGSCLYQSSYHMQIPILQNIKPLVMSGNDKLWHVILSEYDKHLSAIDTMFNGVET